MDKRIFSLNISAKKLMLIRFSVLVFLAVTSLPGLIISVIFAIIFMAIKINKIWFCILGALLAFLTNLKINFYNNFLLGAVNVVKDLGFDIALKKGANCKTIYKVYLNSLVHNNMYMLWQIIIAFILASIIVETYYKDSMIKNILENKSNDKKVNRKIEKVERLNHDPEDTILGIDYSTLKAVKIKDNAKHILIAGTTGSGKTVAISNFIESGMQKGYPIVAVDGKGDLDKGSLLHYMQSLSKKYKRKLYVINFVKPEYSDYYNPFRGAGMTEAKDMLISMSEWTEPHYKINTERYIQQLIKVLNIAKIPLDLNTIIKYSPNQFKKLIEKLKNEDTLDVDYYTKLNEIIEDTGDIAASAMARFATTAESEAGEIFNSSKGIDIYQVIKERANILIILDSLGKPELSNQVGRLAILDAKKAVSKLFGDPVRKFFILDEFNVYASDVAVDLINKSRSANVTCIPAVQSLADLDKAGGEALRNQIIDNCNNYIIMRQNSPSSSQIWENVIGKQEIINYTYSMEEKPGIFGTRNATTGKGNMYKSMESKYTASQIQALPQGQSIFLSKDQNILNKIKVRYVNIDMQNPILDKKIPKDINTSKTTLNNNDIKDLEKILKDD